MTDEKKTYDKLFKSQIATTPSSLPVYTIFFSLS